MVTKFYFIAILTFLGTFFENKPRVVYIQSQKYNGAYGHIVTMIKDKEVLIDTSFYPANWSIPYVDSARVRNNRVFCPDLSEKVNKRTIYQYLINLPLDTLKAYARKSQTQNSSRFEKIIITENGENYTLKFIIPQERIDTTSVYSKFLVSLDELFPNGRYKAFYCKHYFK